MMTPFFQFRMLLLIAALAGITKRSMATTAMRGSTTTTTELSTTINTEAAPAQHSDTATVEVVSPSSRTTQRRRLTVQRSTCKLFRKCVTTLNHTHQDSWVCELSQEDQRLAGGIQFVDIIETQAIKDTIGNTTTSGGSMLSVSHAVIDTEQPQMFIPDDAQVLVHDHVTGDDRVHPTNAEIDRDLFNSGSYGFGGPSIEGTISSNRATRSTDGNRRQLAKTKGSLRTLVIRVIDSKGVQPSANTATMVDNVFQDASSLKTQTEKCSHKKLEIEPFHGDTPSGLYINNGVVDVQMDYDMSGNAKGMDQAALKAAREKLGDLDDDMFDLLLVCFPPGKDDFLAFAYPNSKYSFYNNEWCGYVAAQMHEVGHNLGLAHSGEPGEGEYGDSSGYMGGSPGEDDFKMCYNAQKNYQLGWYEDQVESINPLDGKDKRSFTLNGVVDYGTNNDALIVLRLTQSTKDQDFYIGYNRAKDYNSMTSESVDSVTVIRKEYGAPDQYGQSTKIASLTPGQRTIIEDYNGSGQKIQVAFTGIDDNGNARIMVLKGSNPPPSPPGSCQQFTVEVVTDGYPKDNSWYFKDTGGYGRVGALSINFENSNTEYRQQVCLPRSRSDMTYKFSIEDKYGDGIGNGGGYRVYDSGGKQLFSGGQNFRKDKRRIDHYVEVSGDPSIPITPAPTDYPTMAPTVTPPCRKYLVEVKTDKYPGDTRWQFVRSNPLGDEVIDEESPGYSEKSKVTTTEVCLRTGTQYKFKVFDSYGDGLCCGNANQPVDSGYYKLKDSCTGQVLEDSGLEDKDFKELSYTVNVPGGLGTCGGAEPTQAPTNKPTKKKKRPKNNGRCKNKAKRKFKAKTGRGKKKSCKQYAKAKQCDKAIQGGKYDGKTIGDVCKKNCGGC